MKERNYAMDWLRCWCMFFIVLGHFTRDFQLSKTALLPTILGMGGVNLFVLITGYFGIKKETVIRHFLSIFFTLIFYNLFITFAFFCFTDKAVPIDFVKALYPLGNHKMQYWFVTKYLGLLLLAPFLNLLLERLSIRGMAIFWAVLVFLNTTLALGFPPGNLYGGSWTLMWFICLYVSGRFINRLNEEKLLPCKKTFWLGGILLGYFAAFLIFWKNCSLIEMGYNSLITFFISCCIFGFVMNCRSKSAKLISWVTPCIFAVYLIHQQFFFYSYLQKNISSSFLKWINSPFVAWISMALCVFVVCIFVDRIRLNFFKVCRIDQFIDHIATICTAKIENWIRA